MKISALLKRTVVIVTLLSIYGGCVLLMNNALGITLDEKSNLALMGIGILSLCLLVTYWTIWQEYGSLHKISTTGLVLLVTLSGLSALADVFVIIDYFRTYIPHLAKKADFFAYILFTQISILEIITSMINPFMTFRSAQALYTRFSSNQLAD